MRSNFLKSAILLLSAATPALTYAQAVIDAPTSYYLIHSSGMHASRNSDGKAVLEASDAPEAQMLLFTPTGEGYYTISAPDSGGYMSLSGSYNTQFTDDGSSTRSQWAIRSAGKHYIKLECRANGKFLGTDASTAGASIFSDKSGTDSRHYWFLSTNAEQEPPADEHAYIINPAAERQLIEGWGVSLCWWANMCGKWSDDKIDEIIDWLVSPEGLNFNIFRYNIGGGDDPENNNCTAHHMGSGKGLRAEMEGFKDSSDGPYIWTRDAAQRKIMLKIKEKRPDAIFEAFSNSCPYYMTYSGCVAGNSNSSKDNLRPEFYEEFAQYLVDVCKHYKDEYGIEFRTLDPFNEPMTSYWGANGGQEGCHFDVKSQIDFLKVLAPILSESGLNTMISASDETSVAQSVKDFEAYRDAGVLDLVGQWNTHTYTADNKARAQISALCHSAGMPLWMSEVGAGGNGLEGNLNLARKLIDDIRYIMPSAWIDWQYIEEGNDQWCLVKAGSFEKGTYQRVKNYYVRSHFSRFIKKGYTILSSLNAQTLAARSPEGDRLVLVALNSGSSESEHTVDLSMFASAGDAIEACITTHSDDMAEFTDHSISDKGRKLTFRLPAQSIATLVLPVSIADVSTPPTPQAGRKYLICPRLGADLALDATGGKVSIKTLNFFNAQAWTLSEKADKAYSLTNASGYTLTEKAGEYALSARREAADGQSFHIHPVDGVYYKITNADESKALDLEGEKAVDGNGVGLWDYGTTPTAVHRQWMFIEVADESLSSGIISADSSHDTAIRVSTPEAGMIRIERIEDKTEGILRVFNAAGICIYNSPLDRALIQLPISSGYYIVSFTSAGESSATAVIVR